MTEPTVPGVEPTVGEAERFIHKMEACTSIGVKLILLKNFMLRHAPSSVAPANQSDAVSSFLATVDARDQFPINMTETKQLLARFVTWLNSSPASQQTMCSADIGKVTFAAPPDKNREWTAEDYRRGEELFEQAHAVERGPAETGKEKA